MKSLVAVKRLTVGGDRFTADPRRSCGPILECRRVGSPVVPPGVPPGDEAQEGAILIFGVIRVLSDKRRFGKTLATRKKLLSLFVELLDPKNHCPIPVPKTFVNVDFSYKNNLTHKMLLDKVLHTFEAPHAASVGRGGGRRGGDRVLTSHVLGARSFSLLDSQVRYVEWRSSDIVGAHLVPQSAALRARGGRIRLQFEPLRLVDVFQHVI